MRGWFRLVGDDRKEGIGLYLATQQVSVHQWRLVGFHNEASHNSCHCAI